MADTIAPSSSFLAAEISEAFTSARAQGVITNEGDLLKFAFVFADYWSGDDGINSLCWCLDESSQLKVIFAVTGDWSAEKAGSARFYEDFDCKMFIEIAGDVAGPFAKLGVSCLFLS